MVLTVVAGAGLRLVSIRTLLRFTKELWSESLVCSGFHRSGFTHQPAHSPRSISLCFNWFAGISPAGRFRRLGLLFAMTYVGVKCGCIYFMVFSLFVVCRFVV